MVKICQTGLLKSNFETRPKNAFSGFCQKFPQAMDEVENFGPLGCQGWVVIPQNVRKSQNHCTLMNNGVADTPAVNLLPVSTTLMVSNIFTHILEKTNYQAP